MKQIVEIWTEVGGQIILNKYGLYSIDYQQAVGGCNHSATLRYLGDDEREEIVFDIVKIVWINL